MKLRALSLLTLPVAVTLLAGCGSKTEMEPGEWEVTTRFIDASGPPIARAMLDELKNQRQEHRDCMTEAEARDPKRRIFDRDDSGECSVSDIEWEDGQISGRISCNQANGARMTGDLTGDYSREEFNIDMDARMTIPQLPNQTINTRMRVDGRRVGECRDSDRRARESRSGNSDRER